MSQKEHESDHMFVKASGKMERIMFSQVLYIESLQNYVLIQTTDKKIVTYSTLKNIEALLPANRFIKIHKSFIVAISKISSLQGNNVYIGNTSIPISRKLKDDIRNKILTNNIYEK